MNAAQREKLVVDHIWLVAAIVRGMWRKSALSEEDMIAEGTVGLVQASKNWNPDGGASFRTFAAHRIRGAIIDAQRSDDWMPRLTRVRATKIIACIESMRVELGRDPTQDEVAERTGIGIKQVTDVYENFGSAFMVNLDNPSAFVGEDYVEGPVERVIPYVDEWLLNGSNLTLNEKRVVYLYYYLGLKFSDISRFLGVTESAACLAHGAIVKRAMQDLQHKIKADDGR